LVCFLEGETERNIFENVKKYYYNWSMQNHCILFFMPFGRIIPMIKCLNKEVKILKKNVNIITDPDGRKFVMINDVRFRAKRREDWEEVEKYLKEYVGKCYEVLETSEKVYIGKDFPDEFVHGKDKTILKGPNAKAKANAAQAVGELIQIANNKSSAPDYNSKHGNKAKFGWYRYDTRIALPIYNSNNELERYNIYNLRMLVRHDKDGKIYLYDFLRTKKETSSPLK